MAYTSITRFTSPNHSGRRTKKVTSITIHHWGIPGQKFQNVVNYLCRARGNSSAHYVVEAGKVACIVDPDNIAWHAGVWAGNETSIGIECRPEATAADYATVAELVRDLRKVYGNIPLKRHRDWKATACPGKWDIAKIDRLSRAIPATGGGSGGGGGGKVPSTPGGVIPTPPKTKLVVDGKLGPATIKAWQKAENTKVDGKISTPDSSLIRAVQASINARNAEHKFLSGGPLKVTGKFGARDRVAFVKYLNELNRRHRFLTGAPLSTKKDLTSSRRNRALQKALNLGLIK